MQKRWSQCSSNEDIFFSVVGKKHDRVLKLLKKTYG